MENLHNLRINFTVAPQQFPYREEIRLRARRELAMGIYNHLLELGGMGTVSISEEVETDHYKGIDIEMLNAKIYKVERVPVRLYESPSEVLASIRSRQFTWKEIGNIIWKKLTSPK